MLASNSLLQQLADSSIPVYPSVTGLRQAITLHSLAAFVYALVWAFVLLVSFTGWGRLAGKLLRLQRLPASIACAAGIAVLIFLGGLLNLLHMIYPAVLIGLVAIGSFLSLIFRSKTSEDHRWRLTWKRPTSIAGALWIAMLLILSFRVAGTIGLARFDVSDDSAAYLALPQKMLSTHHFAADPFSERRNTSSLGGSYLLQDFSLSATSLSNIGMADRTEGLILLAAVAFDLGIAFELSALQISVLEFIIFLVPQQTFNLTFIVLPVPLLLAMVWLIFRAENENTAHPLRYALLAGLIAGATISLKSTYLPIAASLSAIPYFISYSPRPFPNRLKLLLVTGAGIVIVLMFWMLAMKLTSGTFLFPIFGRGLDYSARGLFHSVPRFPSFHSIIKVFLQGSCLLLLVMIQILPKPRTKYSMFCAGVLLSAALSIVALNYASSADSIWRYNFPQFFTAVIVFYLASMAASNLFPQSRPIHFTRYVAVAAILFMVFYYDLAGKKPNLFHEIKLEAGNWQALAAGFTGRHLANPRLTAEYLTLENSIPQNGVVLENAAYSFLFNYRSHHIAIMDWPGASAPFPGWPFGETPTELTQYLRENSIRYVIVDYRYMRQNDARMCQDLQEHDRFSEWLKEQLWMNILADQQLYQLMGRYPSIYNDGNMAVVDLSGVQSGSFAENSTLTIHSEVGTACSQVAKQYFSARPTSLNEDTSPFEAAKP